MDAGIAKRAEVLKDHEKQTAKTRKHVERLIQSTPVL